MYFFINGVNNSTEQNSVGDVHLYSFIRIYIYYSIYQFIFYSSRTKQVSAK